MIKKIIIFKFFFLLFSLFTHSQEIRFLKFKIYERNINKPIPFVEVCLYDNDTILYCINSDFDGFFSLFLNTEKNNLDSLYFSTSHFYLYIREWCKMEAGYIVQHLR